MRVKQINIEELTEQEKKDNELYQASNELANQKFLTEYVACMTGVELPVEEKTDVQHFE